MSGSNIQNKLQRHKDNSLVQRLGKIMTDIDALFDILEDVVPKEDFNKAITKIEQDIAYLRGMLESRGKVDLNLNDFKGDANIKVDGSKT